MSCKLCGSPGVNVKTCPLNPLSKTQDPTGHTHALDVEAELLGYGASGCVYSPSLPCIKEDGTYMASNSKMVSKVMGARHYDRELANYKILGKYDQAQEYHIGQPIVCKPIHKKYITACSRIHPADTHNATALVYINGGRALDLALHAKVHHIDDVLIHFSTVILGIRELNKLQIYHLDLKPENIVISADAMRIIDFGLAVEKIPQATIWYSIFRNPYPVWPPEVYLLSKITDITPNALPTKGDFLAHLKSYGKVLKKSIGPVSIISESKAIEMYEKVAKMTWHERVEYILPHVDIFSIGYTLHRILDFVDDRPCEGLQKFANLCMNSDPLMRKQDSSYERYVTLLVQENIYKPESI